MAKPQIVAQVMKGEKDVNQLSEGQLKKALGESIKQIATKDSRMAKLKENGEATATVLIGGVEFTTANFTASFARGYLGEDALKIGGVDARAAAGLLSVGYGIYDLSMNGGKGGGAHAVNLGAGVLNSFIAEAGMKAGAVIKEGGLKGLSAPKAPQAAAQPTLQGQVIPMPTLQGRAQMTPETWAGEEDEAEGDLVTRKIERGQARRNERRTRYVRAQTEHQSA